MGRGLRRIWLLIVLPLAFLLKDIIATMALLSTEPGITARAAFYYSIALLPGTLVAGGGAAMLFNILFGAFLGGILYWRGMRRRPML